MDLASTNVKQVSTRLCRCPPTSSWSNERSIKPMPDLHLPVWWSDCPAKLKGWFDRVWTLGYTYSYENGEHTASGVKATRALVICTAGHPVEHLEEIGIAPSMRCVMLNDRLHGVGISDVKMEILGGMVNHDPAQREKNLNQAYELGRHFDRRVIV